MKSDASGVPARKEIISQLKHLLASAHFSKARTQAEFLRLVVTKALKNETLKETEIGYAIIENYSPESHTVRVNAGLVRTKLDAYYTGEGKDDLVRISLPTGPAYRPVFSYHEQAEALRIHRHALTHKEYGSTRSLFTSMCMFKKVTELFPTYAPAYEEASEADLLVHIFQHTFSVGFAFRTYGNPKGFARSFAERAQMLQPESSQPHILLGADHLSHFRWDEAKVEFDTALALDHQKTCSSLWYASYLMLIGRTAEAVQIAEAQTLEAPDQQARRLVFAFFLYVSREYGKALSVIDDTSVSGRDADLTWLLSGLIHLGKGDHKESLRRLDFVSDISNRDWATLSWFHKFDAAKPESCAGLKILAIAETGEVAKAEEKMSVLRKAQPADPVQIAIGYMGLGRHSRALVALNRAFRQGNIWMNWLHLLPVFDPLRTHPVFQANEADRLQMNQ